MLHVGGILAARHRNAFNFFFFHDDVDSPTSAGGIVTEGGLVDPGTMLPARLRGTSWPVSATLAPRSTL